MNLYLVQHAKSKTEEEDPKKPLSVKGFSDIRKIAVFITKQYHSRVKCIMHSGKLMIASGIFTRGVV